jgi:hypothetical protein
MRTGERGIMGISRKAFKVWLSCTIVWWIATGIFINAGGFFPARYQVNFPLQSNLPAWEKANGWQVDDPLHKPLYEIIRSPSTEKLPVEFQYRGYQGAIWNQHIHSRKSQSFEFSSGETLDLPTGLTDADSEYLKKAFWDQRWTRWRGIFEPYLKSAILFPLAVLAAIWSFRQLRIAFTGKEPPPEAPRLPYSPGMERLRRATLAVGGAAILFWLVIAVLNDPKDPLPFFKTLYLLFPMMLPALAALIMSFLRRGPISAALLAGLGVYLMLPELAVRLLPASWLGSE